MENYYTSTSTKKYSERNKRTEVLLPNRSEEDDINKSGETQDAEGNINLRRSNRLLKPQERLGSVPYV